MWSPSYQVVMNQLPAPLLQPAKADYVCLALHETLTYEICLSWAQLVSPDAKDLNRYTVSVAS